MLNKDELQNITQNYNVNFNAQQITQLAGGDVNNTYLLQSDMGQYVIKKILLEQYVDDYQTTIDEVTQSLLFIEEITRKQQSLGNVITAIAGNSGTVLHTDGIAYILYPFFQGEILENNKITLPMIKQISQRLERLHHHKFSYDNKMSQQKFNRFINVGRSILDSPILSRLDNIKYLIPKLKPIINFITENKASLSESIKLCTPESVCHNDLKPKNVLWASEDNFAIIDWGG